MSEIDESGLHSLPKVELHVHLEGTITPETALLLAARHGTDPETLGLVDGRHPRFNSLSDFIVVYLAVSANIRTPVNVCMSSNVGIGEFPSLEAHPFPTLWHNGVNATVNSDDPAFFSSSLTDELRHAARLAGFGEGGLADLQRRAARASFAPETTKAKILAAIDDWEATP